MSRLLPPASWTTTAASSTPGTSRSTASILAQLDAEAANLDLKVGARGVHDLAVGLPPPEVARAIDARARPSTDAG